MSFGRQFIIIACFSLAVVGALASGNLTEEIVLLNAASQQAHMELAKAILVLEGKIEECRTNQSAPPPPHAVAELLEDMDFMVLRKALFYHSLRNVNECVLEKEKEVLFRIAVLNMLYERIRETTSTQVSEGKVIFNVESFQIVSQATSLLSNISTDYLKLRASYGQLPEEDRDRIEKLPLIDAGRFDAFQIMEEARQLVETSQ